MAKSVENVISEGFSLVKQNYTEFLVLYALFLGFFVVDAVIIVILLLVAGFAGGAGSGSASGMMFAIIFVALIALLGIFVVEPLWIGSYYAIALQLVSGNKISISEAIGKAREKYVALLWTMALETLIFIVIDVIIFLPLLLPAETFFSAVSASGSVSSTVAAGAMVELFGFGIVVIIAYLLVSMALAPLFYEAVPLVMLENLRGVDAIKKSVRIGRDNFWKLIELIVVFLIACGLIGFAQEIVIFVLSLLGALAGSLIGLVLSLLVGAFITAWLYVLQIIFYKDFIAKN